MSENRFKREEATKRNHYVPQVYLKYFCGENGDISCYDKIENNIIKTAPKQVGFENDLYTAEDNIGFKSYEKYYKDEVDDNYDNIMKKIEEYQKCPIIEKPLNIGNLKNELSNFMINQLLRLPSTIYMNFDNYKEYLENMKNEIKNIEKESGEFNEFIKIIEEYKSDKRYKNGMLDILTRNEIINYLSNVLVEKTWILFKNESNTPFSTSDSPIITYNCVSKKTMKLGIGRKDVFIGFPLSLDYYISIIPDNFFLGEIKQFSGKSFVLKDESLETIKFWNQLQLQSCKRMFFIP